MKALSFSPPKLVLGAALEWILQRAIGPLSWQPMRQIVQQGLVGTAVNLGVAGRIAARQPRMLLERELGAEVAQQLREEFLDGVARDALLGRALNHLLEKADTLGVPCILLKYAALSRMNGVLLTGSRIACDLDVLVQKGEADEFQKYLTQNGYTAAGLPASAHQLAALRDPDGVLIEVHVHLPGVTLTQGAPFVDADDLIAAGLTRRLGDALVPDPAIVMAHALVHGLVQHARAPHMYSPLRTFADLADLRAAGYGDFEAASSFVSAAMTETDLTDAIALARALHDGDLEAATENGAGIILRHALASRLSRSYAARLRLRALTQPGPTPLHFSLTRLFSALRHAWTRAR